MARKPSDDIRDAKRDAKIKSQQIDGIQYNSKGESRGWSADPTVKKKPDYRSNKDGFRVDWDEKHHLQGLNLYDSYTAGMSPEQIKQVDARLAQQGMVKGNVGPNRIDLPRRFHESSKHEGYEGAHQVTKAEGIDSRGELDRLKSLTPEQRLNELDAFVEKQNRHRQVGQQKFFQQYQLEPGNNSKTNPFGGNFSQQVLQDRNPAATLKAGKALSKERAALKALAVAGIAAPSVLGTAASAAETTGRANLARKTGNVMDWVQTAISAASLAADPVPVVGEFVSTPADLTNAFIDQHRAGGSTLNGSGRGGGERRASIAINNKGPRGRSSAQRDKLRSN